MNVKVLNQTVFIMPKESSSFTLDARFNGVNEKKKTTQTAPLGRIDYVQRSMKVAKKKNLKS